LEEFEEIEELPEVILPPKVAQPAKVPAPLPRERPGVKEQREAASAIYPRNGKRWNINEDSSLVEAFLKGNSPVEISRLVERTPSAIKGRIIYWVETSNPRLQFRPLKMSKSYARHGKDWTNSECDELKRLWASEISLLNLCEKLQRPKLGVTYKLLEMGFISMNKETLKVVEKFYAKK
jgi:hypothetical protein